MAKAKNSESKKTKKILLVEDDPFLVDIYVTKLKEHNFDLTIATDGKDAFAKIKEEKPDLVLLDIVLPKLDGMEILKKVKNDPSLGEVKIVVLSNLSQNYEISKALELGATSYLIKSHYSPSEVIREITNLLT